MKAVSSKDTAPLDSWAVKMLAIQIDPGRFVLSLDRRKSSPKVLKCFNTREQTKSVPYLITYFPSESG